MSDLQKTWLCRKLVILVQYIATVQCGELQIIHHYVTQNNSISKRLLVVPVVSFY